MTAGFVDTKGVEAQEEEAGERKFTENRAIE